MHLTVSLQIYIILKLNFIILINTRPNFKLEAVLENYECLQLGQYID